MFEHHLGKGHTLVRTKSLRGRKYVATEGVIWTTSLGLRPPDLFLFFCSLLVKCVVVFSIVKGTGDILSKKGGNVRI